MSKEVTLELQGVSKKFESTLAVNDLSFSVHPGKITGFLGPNGAGKTTTLRILLGLVSQDSGRALVNGQSYRELENPANLVGASLDSNSFHPARTGKDTLMVQTSAAGIPDARIAEVLNIVGLTEAANKKVGEYSLGMRQRLGLASAMLGDPQVLVLDEPINGLDPQGITWVREYLKHLASEGRTILVSSHVLSEVEQTVDSLVVINRGKLVYEGTVKNLRSQTKTSVFVSATESAKLEAALSASHKFIKREDGVVIEDVEPQEIGELALKNGIALTQLRTESTGLEKAFLELISNGGAE
ncbi:MAG: ATP-binding cassette domain-containing protein [Microbacteriaceae bacterium]|nr:ATP-binding cassette domain-containing protein [Microbacteriaceae bacterium]